MSGNVISQFMSLLGLLTGGAAGIDKALDNSKPAQFRNNSPVGEGIEYMTSQQPKLTEKDELPFGTGNKPKIYTINFEDFK